MTTDIFASGLSAIQIRTLRSFWSVAIFEPELFHVTSLVTVLDLELDRVAIRKNTVLKLSKAFGVFARAECIGSDRGWLMAKDS
jgi:hypothetical protein